MNRCIFESLPNELILIVFEYLSLFDLYQAFSQTGNDRLVQLLLSKRHSFVVGSLRCRQMCQLLNIHNEVHLKWFTDLIDTLVLDDSLASSVFLEQVSERMDVTRPIHFRLPSMTQLIIFKADNHCSKMIRSLLLPINFSNHPLQRVHLIFEQPTNAYSTILSTLVSNRISFHTMILEVENGYDGDYNSERKDLHRMAPIYLPYTNRLNLSIQHASELELLLKRNVSPALEHLAVTIEQTDLVGCQRPKSLAHLCEQTLRQQVDGTRLRTLFIRHMAFQDLIVLLDSLPMPVLQQLTLIDIYGQTLDHVGRFEEICCSGRLPALKDLYFSFRFPRNLENAWQSSSFGTSDQWPFDNIGCFQNECLTSGSDREDRPSKMCFIVYKHPIKIATNPSHSIQWICNQVNPPDRLLKTFRTIRAVHSKSLCIAFFREGRTANIVSGNCLGRNWSRYHFPASISVDESMCVESSQRVSIVRQVLDASPKVTHLVVHWCDLPDYSPIYSNLQTLHLILERSAYRNEYPFDIERLAQLTPGIRRLEISSAIRMVHGDLVAFILDVITRFYRLVHFVINVACPCRVIPSTMINFLKLFAAACRERGYDGSMIDVCFRGFHEINVWL